MAFIYGGAYYLNDDHFWYINRFRPNQGLKIKVSDEDRRKIYVLNGLPGTGKTLFGKLVGEELDRRGKGFLHTSSIDLVKHVLLPSELWNEKIMPKEFWDPLGELKRKLTDLDWDGQTKDVYWRGIMSDLKLAINSAYPTLINEWLWTRILSSEEKSVIFVDIREPENIESFRNFCHEADKGGWVRTICVLSDTNDHYDNISDGSVMNYRYDIYVENNRGKFTNNIEGALNQLKKVTCEFVESEIGLGWGCGVEAKR